jgi:hypothetical protein
MIRGFEKPYTQGLCQIPFKWLKYKYFQLVEMNTAALSQRKARKNVAAACNAIGGHQGVLFKF